MADDNGILQAEQRVREMNRMTRQYSEQGNRFLRDMTDTPPQRQTRQVRFEPAPPSHRRGNGQDIPSETQSGDISTSSPQQSGGEEHTRTSERQILHSSSGVMSRSFTADNEKIMILLLMYLLMKEKADIKLLLALGYLLL